jgi:hypothetical protein
LILVPAPLVLVFAEEKGTFRNERLIADQIEGFDIRGCRLWDDESVRKLIARTTARDEVRDVLKPVRGVTR